MVQATTSAMKKRTALPYKTKRDFIVDIITDFGSVDPVFFQLQEVLELTNKQPSDDFLNTTYFFIQNLMQLQKAFTSKKVYDRVQERKHKIEKAEKEYEETNNNSDSLLNSL